MSSGSNAPPLSAIFGCSGLELTADERSFFAEVNPVGFILFGRNVSTPEQVAALVGQLRDSVRRGNAPVLIDQEGGRVTRLRPPHWRKVPAAGVFSALAGIDQVGARRAAWLNSRLLADELAVMGINVDCLPVLDLRLPDAHDIVGDRSYGEHPDSVAVLGRAVCDGLLAGGVLPVIKHIPGHGRALADSHFDLPRVTTDIAVLEATDFVPFRALREMPLAMTAHILYRTIDARHAATVSRKVIRNVVRGSIGFGGLLMTDDVSMKALGGSLGDRTRSALRAGCDVVLHCNGNLEEMEEIAGAARPLDPAGERRLARALDFVHGPEPLDREEALTELGELIGRVGAQG